MVIVVKIIISDRNVLHLLLFLSFALTQLKLGKNVYPEVEWNDGSGKVRDT